ncbi:MAG: selenocysteine-specific translation elongation factor [Promethearchaeota archaeon]|nr:MAG: selenocysteine-specific translation elongation factor [Candidatus Lokiarchaeota archaeon]
MDVKEKVPIHIGLFGHIDSGKTAIAEVLSEIISTAGIDAHPQSKERGITIDLGFSSFVLDQFLITLVDGPGHADLIKISASSVEIIDCAILVIDVNKGPQVQTGEHLIMIESLNIKDVIVVLNKIDLFKGNIEKEIGKMREFFATTSFGSKVPMHTVSARDRSGFEELRHIILKTIKSIEIKRDLEGDLIIPIDHHFTIKGMGPIVTGTILSGRLSINQQINVLPVNTVGRVKNIQIFHQNVESAKAGDRVGINIKNLDIKKIYRGCIATGNPNAFEISDILEVRINKNELFRPDTHFGSQIHITIGMFTTSGKIYPYEEIDNKKIQRDITRENNEFNAFLWLNEKVLIHQERSTMLLSRLDLPPTTLRILGSAKLLRIHEKAPFLYRYKFKRGRIQKDLVCTGLAQSSIGAKKIIGRQLESPFTKIVDTFGTKGAVIVGVENPNVKVDKGDPVILKELRSFRLKKI